MNNKFMAWDWDGTEFVNIPTNNVVEAIYTAWNYEFDVYEVETKNLIFSGKLNNEDNSELLEKYGVRMVNEDGRRHLQNVETEEVYKASWQ